jgi:reactive chlorine resistance protein C
MGVRYLDIRNFSRALGMVEVTLALLIAARSVSPRASLIGSLAAIAMFPTTLSFLLTTPGVWQPNYGFPSLSGSPGQFLVKDIVLLGAAVWTAGEAWLAIPAGSGLTPETSRT